MTLRKFALLVPFLAACSAASTSEPTPDGGERGSLGKADIVGSCQLPDGGDACNGPGFGNCWCDEACVDFGDCCSDVDYVCGVDVPPPEPEGEPCGGFLGLACDEGEFCMWDEDEFCGAADHLGECTEIPEFCIEIFAPVCGCDGETYDNSCFAATAGTSVVHEGACEEPSCEPVLCELFCEHGFATDETGCEVCECAPPPPKAECKVAGCSSELCVGPDGPDFSICIFEDWYVCLPLSTCGQNGPDGECGWEMNPEYVECLTSFGQ